MAGVCLNLSAMLLKLGLPTVILLGAFLFQRGDVSLFVYMVFLLVSAMVYNPVQEVFAHLAILSFLDVRINRMKEIEQCPHKKVTRKLR